MTPACSARPLQPLPVPAGAEALSVVPALHRALEGAGPALLPVADDDGEHTRRVRETLRAGEPLQPGEDAADDPTSLVVATSGSTGAPKGVLLPASALRASAEATHRALGGPGHWLLAMPAQHIAGIQVLVRAILAGTAPHAVDTADGFRAERFAAAARAVPADGPRYTALVPTQLGRLLDDAEGCAALRGFDAVLLGGAATPAHLLQRAAQADVRVITTYGMSETAGGCVYDGVPLEAAQVAVDAADPAEPGAVRLSGPMLARGYRDRPEHPAFADGWFHTGDLGRWQQGRLRVLGRADDVIVTGGVNIAPAEVERVLAAEEGVHEVCVFGVDDPEWGRAVAAAVVPGDGDPLPADADAEQHPLVARLRAAVRARAQPAAVPKRWVFRAALPLRGPGKPDRRALAQQITARQITPGGHRTG
ncbi:o-succinylbenzoate--CoA ligase [Bounagaea algeriensis]